MTWQEDERERLVRILAGAIFLIFFQAYMVAPLIPRLAAAFSVSEERIGLIVLAYLIPYGIATLFHGVLTDRIGRSRVLLYSLTVSIAVTALTATWQTETQLVLSRFATGLLPHLQGEFAVLGMVVAVFVILWAPRVLRATHHWLLGEKFRQSFMFLGFVLVRLRFVRASEPGVF